MSLEEVENQSAKRFESFIAGYLGGITFLFSLLTIIAPEFEQSGTASVLIGSPLDTIKVRLQIQSHAAQVYTGPFDCAKKIMREEGLPGFYRGSRIIPTTLTLSVDL